MPKKTMYPCQYPDCPALYDEMQAGRIDGLGAMLTGWMFPPGTQVTAAMVRSHEHILNVMHKVERDTDIHDMDDFEGTGCAGLVADPDGPQLEEGAWQCGNGHMFRYEPPPASPPWCVKTECHAGDFRWIIKDEVTARDWLPPNLEEK